MCRNTTKIPPPLTRNLACLTARDITFQGKLNFSETVCKEKSQLVLPTTFWRNNVLHGSITTSTNNNFSHLNVSWPSQRQESR